MKIIKFINLPSFLNVPEIFLETFIIMTKIRTFKIFDIRTKPLKQVWKHDREHQYINISRNLIFVFVSRYIDRKCQLLDTNMYAWCLFYERFKVHVYLCKTKICYKIKETRKLTTTFYCFPALAFCQRFCAGKHFEQVSERF